MKLEGVIHCEGPRCDAWERVSVYTMAVHQLPPGWIQSSEYGDQGPITLSFCCWDCVLKRAGQVEPPTIIPWDQALGIDEEPS